MGRARNVSYLNEPDWETFQIGQVKRRAVECRYVPVIGDQLLNEVDADKARASGNKSSFFHRVWQLVNGVYSVSLVGFGRKKVTAQSSGPIHRVAP